MKTFLTVTLALVLSSGVAMADRHHAATPGPIFVKGPVPTSAFWIGYPFPDGASAAALFSAHASDVMSPVMISTGDVGSRRFIVFFQIHGDAFYVPASQLAYGPSATNAAALVRLDASTAQLKGMSSMPDGSTMVWEVSP